MKDMGETDRYRYAVLCLDYPSQWNHSSVFSGSLYCSRDSEVTMKDMGETDRYRYDVLCLDYPPSGIIPLCFQGHFTVPVTVK